MKGCCNPKIKSPVIVENSGENRCDYRAKSPVHGEFKMNVDNKVLKVKKSNDSKGQARITCPPTLANNIDTIKISFWVNWLSDTFLAEIDGIKESIQNTTLLDEQPYHCPGDFNWNVQRTGIKLFNFRLLAGDLRLFLNNRKSDSTIPNVMLEIGSESCWAPGYQQIYENFIVWLKLLDGIVEKEIISEVHLAADLIGLPISSLNIQEKDYWITKAPHFTRYEKHRELTGIAIGKNSLMLRVYDKVREIQRSGTKQDTYSEFWGVENYNEKPVTRVEFQIRRKILKDLKKSEESVSGIDTVEDLNASLNAIWSYCACKWTRHCKEKVDFKMNHQGRAINSKFWDLVSKIEWSGDQTCSRQKPRPKKDYVALRKQFAGIGLSLAAFHNAHPTDLDHIMDITRQIIEEDLTKFYLDNESEFIRRFEKKQREIYESVSALHKLKPVHPESGFMPTPFGTFEPPEALYV